MKNNILKGVSKNKDFWIGVFIIIFGTILLISTGVENKDHYIFPRFIFWMMIVTGAGISVNTLFEKSVKDSINIKFSKREMITLIIFFVSVQLIKVLGFYTSMTLMTICLTLFFVKNNFKKVFSKVIIYGVLVNVILYLIFSVGLRINTPTGLLI